MVEETLQTCIKLEVENVEACAKVGLNKDTEIESIISLFHLDSHLDTTLDEVQSRVVNS